MYEASRSALKPKKHDPPIICSDQASGLHQCCLSGRSFLKEEITSSAEVRHTCDNAGSYLVREVGYRADTRALADSMILVHCEALMKSSIAP